MNLIKIPISSFDEKKYKTLDLYMKDIYLDYLKWVTDSNLLPKDAFLLLEEVCDELIEVVSTCCKGFSGVAYGKFNILMSKIIEDIEKYESTSLTRDEVSFLKNKNFDDLIKEKKERFAEEVIGVLIPENDIDNLLRLRKKQNNDDKYFQKKDLFHNPITNYRNINNYRYSIAGYPCLYLSKSFRSCYEELERPYIEELWISRFQSKKRIKLIDLTKNITHTLYVKEELDHIYKNFNIELKRELMKLYKYLLSNAKVMNRKTRRDKFYIGNKLALYEDIKNEVLRINNSESIDLECLEKLSCLVKGIRSQYDKKEIDKYEMYINKINFLNSHFENILISQILVYPLQIAVSIKKGSSGFFTPEYIIPQFLMQWIRENPSYYGVKYISTKKNNNIDIEWVNYAFPARNFDDDPNSDWYGYCKDLRNIFDITDPSKVTEDIKFESLIKYANEWYNENF